MKTFILAFALISSVSQAALSDKHKAAIKALDTQLSSVDAYLNSFTPALSAEMKAALSADIKAHLLYRAREQSRPYVELILKDIEDKAPVP